jgi:hypothetical protein
VITEYLPYIGVSVAFGLILQPIFRLLALMTALRGTKPSERAAIIRAMAEL